jgi:hypothetical protein
MQNAAVGYSALAEGQDNNHGSVVANLKSLIEQVRASIALVETAIASEFAAEFCDGNQKRPPISSCWTMSRRLTSGRMRC